MADTLFTQIIKGKIPSYKVYEDDYTFAFLDIEPLTPGHVLVVPKKEVDHLWDLADEDYECLLLAAKKVALRIRQVLNPPRVGMNVEGFGVPHIHIHVYPLHEGLETTMAEFSARTPRR